MEFNQILSIIQRERKSFSGILILLGITLLAMVIGNVLSAAIMIAIGDITMADLGNLNESLMRSKKGWWALVLGQGVASLFTFGGSAWFYWKVVEGKDLDSLNFSPLKNPSVYPFLFVLQMVFMPLNVWFQQLNKSIPFPNSWTGFETYLQEMEKKLEVLTEYLVSFETFAEFLAAFLVIAIIAGVTEELLFRGLLQRKLYGLFQNPHLAIWVSATIFSLIHFQFYGFLPRLFLGALFGYFFLWSGNIWVPIAAHIFNNGLAVVLYFLANKNLMSKEVAEMEEFPLPVVMVSILLTLVVGFYTRKNLKSQEIIS